MPDIFRNSLFSLFVLSSLSSCSQILIEHPLCVGHNAQLWRNSVNVADTDHALLDVTGARELLIQWRGVITTWSYGSEFRFYSRHNGNE